MKSFYIAMLLFLVVLAVTVIHIGTVNSFHSGGIEILQSLDNAVSNEDYETAKIKLSNFDEFYQNYRRWFALFLDTADLELIELRAARMRRFLEMEETASFYAEFVELYEIVRNLPYREGIHFEILF